MEEFDILVENLRKKGFSYREIFSMMQEDSNESIPVSIFHNRKLGPLEAIIVYLRDERKLAYHEIGTLINRNDRTVWTSYKKAKEKLK